MPSFWNRQEGCILTGSLSGNILSAQIYIRFKNLCRRLSLYSTRASSRVSEVSIIQNSSIWTIHSREQPCPRIWPPGDPEEAVSSLITHSVWSGGVQPLAMMETETSGSGRCDSCLSEHGTSRLAPSFLECHVCHVRSRGNPRLLS